jgi:Lrp/AsnC family transcriptional regulator, leucine-responsive regulatory protein
MDRIDRKILALYQADTRRIAESIGAEVGLSAAAVQRRLKRLRDKGVNRANIAVLDGAAVGAPITCIVTLSMASAPHELDSFKRAIRAEPEVQQCYQVTGGHDFVLVIAIGSMEAYGSFARRWFEGNAHVLRYETSVVLDRVKIGLSVPVAPDDAPGRGR